MTTIAPPRRLGFRPAPGWSVMRTHGPLPADANIFATWATNVEIAAADRVSTWPLETARTLPENGVIVYACITSEVDDPEVYPARTLPLTLAGEHLLTSNYGNQPAPHVSETIVYARIADQYLLVVVYFGSHRPSGRVRREADQQLARLTVE
jgi:hypothetical protein